MNHLHRVVSRLSCGLAVATGFLIGLIVIIVCLDVAARALLGGSIQSAGEVAILLMVAQIFLGFGGAQAEKANFSVELVTNALPAGIRRALTVLTLALASAAIGLLAYYSWRRAITSYEQGEATYGVIAFPVWPNRIVIALGLTVLAVQLLADAFAAPAPRAANAEDPERRPESTMD
jgi:TRAP-type C4-dicarboxylate transport system permease small subunit